MKIKLVILAALAFVSVGNLKADRLRNAAANYFESAADYLESQRYADYYRSANAENAQRMQMIMQILQLQEQQRQFDAMMRERQRQMDWGY